MIRNVILASAIALVSLGAAQAAEPGPRILGGGSDQTVVYDAPSPNRAGGGDARIIGGGENQSLNYAATTAQTPSGLVGQVIGGGESRKLVYRAQQPAPTRLLAGSANRQGG